MAENDTAANRTAPINDPAWRTQTAAVLYPSTPPQPEAAPEPETHRTAEESARTADILYPTAPKLDYLTTPYSHLSRELDRRLPELFTEAGVDEAQRATLRREVLAMATQTKLPEATAMMLADQYLDVGISEARSPLDAAGEEALAAQVAAWDREVRTQLAALYGKEEGPRVLKQTQAWVAQHPALQRALGVRGLGSKPDVVYALVDYVKNKKFRTGR